MKHGEVRQRRPIEGCDVGTWEWTEDPARRSRPGWVRLRCGEPAREIRHVDGATGEICTIRVCAAHGRRVRP